MFKSFRLFSFVSVAVVMLSGIPAASAAPIGTGATESAATVFPGTRVDALSGTDDVDTDSIPQVAANEIGASAAARAGTQLASPMLNGVSSEEYAARKAAALAGAVAAQVGAAHASAPRSREVGPLTAGLTAAFQGLNNGNNATLNGFTLQPSDQALAVGPKQILQAVNDAVNVYDLQTNGTYLVHTGFPKSLAKFFKVPSPGACSVLPSDAPFVTDPRAFYDASTSRFFVAMLEIEGLFGPNPCPAKSIVWIAVSKGLSASGGYWIYKFDTLASIGEATDFPQFGFSGDSVGISGNDFNSSGTAFLGAFWGKCNKAQMMSGGGLNCNIFVHPSAGVLLDTIQPVETLGAADLGPSTQLFVNSFNINSGGGQCNTGCSGLVVWSLAANGAASGLVISSSSYSLPPSATNPGGGNVDTNDTRISGTPTYRGGRIYGALTTRINNGSGNVPGILWFTIKTILGDLPSVAINAQTAVENQGYFFYSGTGSAYYPSVATDSDSNETMVFNYSGNGFNPSAVWASRRSTELAGSFQDGGVFLVGSTTPTSNFRWGDYSATSPAPNQSGVCFATQWSNGDWATAIGCDKFNTGTN